jgi:hypothetical protein
LTGQTRGINPLFLFPVKGEKDETKVLTLYVYGYRIQTLKETNEGATKMANTVTITKTAERRWKVAINADGINSSHELIANQGFINKLAGELAHSHNAIVTWN